MSEGERKEELERILEGAEHVPDDAPQGAPGVRIGPISGHGNQVVVGGNIIINDARRPGERVDDDQLRELRDRVDSLARIDFLRAARDPRDDRDPLKRLEAARLRHWRAFCDHFRLKNHTHLAGGRFNEALCWLENRKQDLLSAGGPPKDKRPAGPSRPIRNALRLLFLGLVVLAAPLMFSVERIRPPDPAVTGPIAAITTDQAPQIQHADAVLDDTPYEPGFHLHAGCSILKPTRAIAPAADVTRHDI